MNRIKIELKYGVVSNLCASLALFASSAVNQKAQLQNRHKLFHMPQQREQHHIANRLRIGQQHDQAIDTDP